MAAPSYVNDIREVRVRSAEWPTLPRFEGESSAYVWVKEVREVYERVRRAHTKSGASIFDLSTIHKLWPYEIEIAFLEALQSVISPIAIREIETTMAVKDNKDDDDWTFNAFIKSVVAHMSEVMTTYYATYDNQEARVAAVAADKLSRFGGSPVKHLLDGIKDSYNMYSIAIHKKKMEVWATTPRYLVYEEVRFLIEEKVIDGKDIFSALFNILPLEYRVDIKEKVNDPIKLLKVCIDHDKGIKAMTGANDAALPFTKVVSVIKSNKGTSFKDHRKPKEKKKVNCWYCGIEGHVETDCRKKQRRTEAGEKVVDSEWRKKNSKSSPTAEPCVHSVRLLDLSGSHLPASTFFVASPIAN